MIYMQTIPAILKDHTFGGPFLDEDELAQLSPDERWKYERRLRHYRDYRNVVMTAYYDGYASGVKQKLDEISDDLLRKKLALIYAADLKENEWPAEKITRITGLPCEIISNL